MMKNKRGQVALEFLMTYGWAILIISIVAVLIWQLGLFNPAGQIKPGKSGFWGVGPYDDFVLRSDGTLILPIENNVGGTITVQSISARVNGFSETDLDPGSHMDTSPDAAPGEMLVWTYSDQPLWVSPEGSSYRVFISITYNDSRTTDEYMSSGWIWGNVEA